MSAPNPKKQKLSLEKLDRLFSDASNVWVIHYSCESFYDRPNGASPRITSIVVRRLESGQAISFSIHQIAEKHGVSFEDIQAHYDRLEKQMLEDFYGHIGSHRGMKYMHWNMRDANFGFAALDHRFRVLGGTPVIVEEEKKFDLSRLLIDIYGVGYINHPRLDSLLKLNSITPRDFMTGQQEAEAFETGNYVGLHQSTLRKVDVLANIAERAHNRQLKTNTSWWEMHGGRFRTFLNWLAENKVVAFLASIASLVGLAITVYAMR